MEELKSEALTLIRLKQFNMKKMSSVGLETASIFQ